MLLYFFSVNGLSHSPELFKLLFAFFERLALLLLLELVFPLLVKQSTVWFDAPA